MQIEVRTATERCAERCPLFKVASTPKTIERGDDGKIKKISVWHYCEHLGACRAVLEQFREEEGAK